jgi:hypothetical protein
MAPSIAADIKPMRHEKGKFLYGDCLINYDVIRRAPANDAQAKKVVIKVHPDLRVVAIAPECASSEDIYDAMVKRARWIYDSVDEFSKLKDHVLPRTYTSGEVQFYLGRRYVLKVNPDTEEMTSVKLERGKLFVSLSKRREKKPDVIRSVVNNWYNEKAKAIFTERLNIIWPKATWVKDKPKLQLRTMRKQWGSCSSQGTILLNPHLVKAPKECIDYVILHEMCHIAEHNHSERFWRLLTQVMPNWKSVKNRLDSMSEMYLND